MFKSFYFKNKFITLLVWQIEMSENRPWVGNTRGNPRTQVTVCET